MILFFDTETTGFVDKKKPANWEGQPRLVQLGAVLTEDDGTERAVVNLIVRPEPMMRIPEQASRVHGITDEIAFRCGVTPKSAMGVFFRLVEVSDLLVAHNMAFDLLVMQAEAYRNGQEKIAELLQSETLFCTMETATPIVNLPPTDRMLAAGFNKPKAPKLEECIRYFFGEEIEGAHDALVDVRACARVYFHLLSLEDTP